ncbi:MAG: polysaccharide deacetylase family protein [Oscillospiraceae bacterium]|nr:polysaccharide deacetylase family protein [Oscillospiraceae bacterium]
MNRKIKMILILSTVFISLAGCSEKSMNNAKDGAKNVVDDVGDAARDLGEAAGDAADAVYETGSDAMSYDNNNNYNNNGSYSDTDGFVDDNKYNNNLEDDIYDITSGVESDVSQAVQTMAPIDFNKINSLDNKKQGWGHGKNKNQDNQPIDAIKFQEKYGKYNSYFIRDLDKKNIYLTFDEGYENGYTGPILDILKQKGVSAVFFVTLPYVKDNPDLINRMINEGHIVGNHSVKHKSFPTISVEEGSEEVEGLHGYMKENYNYDMTLFRFPCGEFSERSLALLDNLGYKSVFWSFAYADWDPEKQMSCDEAKEKILSSAHNGAIYLLHAVSKTNSEILGDVIDQLKNQGYKISKF